MKRDTTSEVDLRKSSAEGTAVPGGKREGITSPAGTAPYPKASFGSNGILDFRRARLLR